MFLIKYPKETQTIYQRRFFAGINNLHRVTAVNTRRFKAVSNRDVFIVKTENILVSILQHLSINPSWDIEFLISYVRYMANNIASVRGINNINSRGFVNRGEFFSKDIAEYWFLNTNSRFNNSVTIPDKYFLNPVVPIYTNFNDYGYLHPSLIKETGSKASNPRGLAVLSISILELAIGYWISLKEDETCSISEYIARDVLPKAKLHNNQLTFINVIYDIVVEGKERYNHFEMEHTSFNTTDETKYLKEFVDFTVDNISSRRLQNFEHFLNLFYPIHVEDYLPFFMNPGKDAEMTQTAWGWELPVLKLYCIYLAVLRADGQQAQDIKSGLKHNYSNLVNRYNSSINSPLFKKEVLGLLEKINELNK